MNTENQSIFEGRPERSWRVRYAYRGADGARRQGEVGIKAKSSEAAQREAVKWIDTEKEDFRFLGVSEI